MTTEPTRTPVSDNSPLRALYWLTLSFGLLGLITWIIASTNVHVSSSSDGLTTEYIDTTAQDWATLGMGAFVVGFIGFFLALTAHAINWQIMNRAAPGPEPRPRADAPAAPETAATDANG